MSFRGCGPSQAGTSKRLEHQLSLAMLWRAQLGAVTMLSWKPNSLCQRTERDEFPVTLEETSQLWGCRVGHCETKDELAGGSSISLALGSRVSSCHPGSSPQKPRRSYHLSRFPGVPSPEGSSTHFPPCQSGRAVLVWGAAQALSPNSELPPLQGTCQSCGSSPCLLCRRLPRVALARVPCLSPQGALWSRGKPGDARGAWPVVHRKEPIPAPAARPGWCQLLLLSCDPRGERESSLGKM